MIVCHQETSRSLEKVDPSIKSGENNGIVSWEGRRDFRGGETRAVNQVLERDGRISRRKEGREAVSEGTG